MSICPAWSCLDLVLNGGLLRQLEQAACGWKLLLLHSTAGPAHLVPELAALCHLLLQMADSAAEWMPEVVHQLGEACRQKGQRMTDFEAGLDPG